MKESHTLNDYPAILRENPDSTYTVFLRNYDGAISEADTLENAQAVAKALLLDVFDSVYSKGQIIPCPARAQTDDYLIHLSLDQVLKIMLRNGMVEKKCTKAELSRGLKIPSQRINGYLSFYKTTSLETLEKAFRYLGYKLTVTIN